MWGVGGHGAEWSRAAVRALGSWIGRVWLRLLRVLARDVLLGGSLAVRLPGESQIADHAYPTVKLEENIYLCTVGDRPPRFLGKSRGS